MKTAKVNKTTQGVFSTLGGEEEQEVLPSHMQIEFIKVDSKFNDVKALPVPIKPDPQPVIETKPFLSFEDKPDAVGEKLTYIGVVWTGSHKENVETTSLSEYRSRLSVLNKGKSSIKEMAMHVDSRNRLIIAIRFTNDNQRPGSKINAELFDGAKTYKLTSGGWTLALRYAYGDKTRLGGPVTIGKINLLLRQTHRGGN